MIFARASVRVSLALFVAVSALGMEKAPATSAPEPWQDCADCPELVTIAPGTFLMGRDDGEPGRFEGPVHEVTIAYSFALGRTEVTHGQFTRFVAATGYEPTPGCEVYPKQPERPATDFSWRDPGYGRAPLADEPVACVSWRDAMAYVAWLTETTGKPYRLPSEAEWEYAARAGTTTAFYWGDNADDACAYANIYDRAGLANGFNWAAAACDSGFVKAAPVGSFKPNAFGLYDMLGNVWEWVGDCYVVPYAAPVDGSAHEVAGACDRRSVRGGSWITRPDRNTASFRGRDPDDTHFSMFGFRVARDLTADAN